MEEEDIAQLTLLGNRLRNFRTTKGFSQETLAEMTGLDRTYISGLERGKRNPSFLILQKLSRVLSISPNQLFTGGEY